MSSEEEGTPMQGPLPLELQQMKAHAEAAAALARRSEESSYGEICIKLRRSSTGDTATIVCGEDAATRRRRSSRPVKRKKFNDELQLPNRSCGRPYSGGGG